MLGQEQGLIHDSSTRQNMYALAHYIDKWEDKWRCVLMILYDQDQDTIPVIMWNMIGNLASSRWLSTEKKAALFVQMLHIPAKPDFLERVQQLVPGLQSEWDLLCKQCRCIQNSNRTSAYMIALTVLMNACDGSGKSSESGRT